MQRSCKELKRIARANLENKYTVPMKAYIYTAIILMLIELPFSLLQTEEVLSTQNIVFYVAEFIISVVAIVLTCGEYLIHLKMAKGETATIKDLFYPLKNQPDRYILARLLFLGLIVLAILPLVAAILLLNTNSLMLLLLPILLSLLSLILVMMIALNYDLVFYLMLDNENLTVIEAFKTCRGMMKGNKGRYLYMMLSFLGMTLLATLSLGIAMLWVSPYMKQTLTLFYLEVSGQGDYMNGVS